MVAFGKSVAVQRGMRNNHKKGRSVSETKMFIMKHTSVQSICLTESMLHSVSAAP